ncbi:hypothetical protein [Jatrophihabitans sp.]|uniref:phage tail tube protein n=1 Tax=Jatrophihabitans sp. TaxID=1932789 RepID=UPI0030C6CAF0|nr:hypothetical protein [Jatrophihabitans sp.]
MTEPLRPAATKTYGKKNWIWIPTWATYTSGTGPTAAEINSASGLDITRILFADGAPTPTQETNLVEQQRRWGDTAISQFVGETKHAGGQIEYQMASQAAAAADGVKLWELIPEGTTGFIVRRLGVARATTPAAGQFVTGWAVEFGPSLEIEKGEGENAESGATCMFAITSPPVKRVAILA